MSVPIESHQQNLAKIDQKGFNQHKVQIFRIELTHKKSL